MRPLTYLVSASLLLLGAVVVFRVFVRRDYHRLGRLGFWGSALEWLIFSMLACFIYLDSVALWPPPALGSLKGALGWGLVTVGAGATVGMIGWFGFRRACGLEVSELVQTGPYRVTRNPQALACGVAVLGYALLWPSWQSAGWVVLYAVVVHLMILTEEEHLRSVYGDAYVRFCERVPRYVWLGPR
jgi:protein-S-isoprenylcysteine O-methyltransferase Ste14